MKRWVLGTSCGILLGTGACVETKTLFSVEVDVVEAEAVDGRLADARFVYVPDVGRTDGNSVPDGTFDVAEGMTSMFVEVIVDGVAFGRSPPFAVPDEGAVSTTLLLAPTRPDVLIRDPPSLGGDHCVCADEAGQVYLLGGSDSTQQAYRYNREFRLEGFGGSDLVGATVPFCAAHGGIATAVSVCDTSGALIVLVGDRVDTFFVDGILDGGDFCAAAPAGGDRFWFFDGANVLLVSPVGLEGPARSLPRTVVDLEVLANGNVVVFDGEEASVVTEDGVIALSPATAIGRRFEDVMLLDGDDLNLVDANTTTVIRGDVDVGSVSSFTVLSDDTVVATSLDGTSLLVSRPGEATQGIRLPRTRTHVSALPGDTVVLAGGAAPGLDVIALP